MSREDMYRVKKVLDNKRKMISEEEADNQKKLLEL